jgi:hypothetical protein
VVNELQLSNQADCKVGKLQRSGTGYIQVPDTDSRFKTSN